MYSSQEWLQKKKEKSKQNMELKKKEEMLNEKKKRVNNVNLTLMEPQYNRIISYS